MPSIKKDLLAALADALEQLSPGAGDKAAFESPKVAAHGDLACTAAMQLAKGLKQNPRELGERLRTLLLAAPAFERWALAVEIAGPGFINIRLKPAAKQETVRAVLQEGARFGSQPPDEKRRMIVEFVSANPDRAAACRPWPAGGAGRCHLQFVRHPGRAGVSGVLLQRCRRADPDAGRQHAGARQGHQPRDAGWPEPAYNGDYIADIAADFLARKTVKSDDREFTASGDVEDIDSIRQFAVAYLRREQDLDLKAFSVHFDHYYLESSLYSSGRVDSTVQRLKDAGKTYEQDGALWLRSTDYGDDKDRVMRKSDGSYTYFVPDVAYHLAKFERGYTQAINIQGMDHHGTIARVRAGLQAANVGVPAGYPDYVLHTMVRVMRGGAEVKISKRAGSYVTLRDLIEWTSADAVRFFLLSRKPDTEYVFDIDLALAKNNENPVYYVQYAHARICSVLAAWETQGGDASRLKGADLSPLDSPPAQALMLLLEKYPDMLANAAFGLAPHDVAFYLRELAASYHSYYDAERILVDDEAVKLARLALVAATAQVLHNGLAVLGVSAPRKM